MEARKTWARVGTRSLAVACTLVGLAVLVSFIGLVSGTAGSLGSSTSIHGQTWASVGLILVILSVGGFALARTESGVWHAERDLNVGLGLGGLAALFALIGLILFHAAGAARAATSGPTWTGFGTVWGFAALGWLLFTRPLDRARAMTAATISGGIALLFTVIGLALGLGDSFTDVLHSQGWLGAATVAAILATGAALGIRRDPL